MYKTIRHGENSLQYKILPQNDDFRIEGKLSSCSSESGNANKKAKAKRPKRRSFFAYLGLIFVCTVIVGAVLIPFLVSAECLPNPTEWFLRTKAALTKSITGVATTTTRINDGSKAERLHASVHGHNGAQAVMGNGINVGKTVKIINEDGVEKIILKVNKTANVANASEAANPVNNNNKQIDNIPSNTNLLDKIKASAAKMAADNEATIMDGNGSGSSSSTIQNENLKITSASNVLENGNAPNSAQQAAYLQQQQQQEPQQPQHENYVAEIRFDAAASPNNVIAPTIIVTTLKSNNNNAIDVGNKPNNNNNYIPPIRSTAPTAINIRPTVLYPAANNVNGINSPRAPSYAVQNQNNTVPAAPTIVTRIIQVPLLKSAAKKPIIPPVLVKTNSKLDSATNTNNNNNNNNIANDKDQSILSSSSSSSSSSTMERNENMPAITYNMPAMQQNADLHSHWPYIDPSTYFQWTGYKAEDSVLLPALLGFALIGMILIITVCLVARNKRTIVSSVRKRNRNDIEETGAEDNATLLTTTNLSDED